MVMTALQNIVKSRPTYTIKQTTISVLPVVTLVNQKALVAAATLRSRLFNALEWAKNGGSGKQKIFLFLL